MFVFNQHLTSECIMPLLHFLISPSDLSLNLDNVDVASVIFQTTPVVITLKAKHQIAFLPNVMTSVGCRSFVVRPSQSERLIYLKNGSTTFTKFYTDIRANLLSIHTGYDLTSCFWSEVIAKKLSKMPPTTVLCRISRERFKWGSQNFAALSGTNSFINSPWRR